MQRTPKNFVAYFFKKKNFNGSKNSQKNSIKFNVNTVFFLHFPVAFLTSFAHI